MKAYINTLIYIIFVALLLASCHTKRQITSDAPIGVVQQQTAPASDTFNRDYSRVNYHFDSSTYNHEPIVLTAEDHYETAYQDLMGMLEGKKKPDFELAVFISENPYHDGRYSYSAFQEEVNKHLLVVKTLIAAYDKSDTIDFNPKVNQYGRFKLDDVRYLPKERKELYRKALSNWAVFKYLTDTVHISIKDSTRTLCSTYHVPYAYATADPFGMKNWANSQVINLLISEKNKGNCFALTGLYKILSDRLNADARICTAPQHIYIQHRNPKGHYYNVELATAGHPGDGIIQTLTYTPTDAIMSGIALRDYDTKQSVGLCLVNLAKSYEHKFNVKDDEFMLRCAELVLKHDSLNLNALLLKQQVLDARVVSYAKKKKIKSIVQLKGDSAIAQTVFALEKNSARLQSLGYRQMPEDMQAMIMNQLQHEQNKWNHKSKNPRPFTSFEPEDPKDAEYWTLTAGMFQEVFEPSKTETYGHFTVNAATKKLVAIDTTEHKGFLIDPVAFAYDFGARIYDARIGRFISIDPQAAKYPSMSPYSAFGNSPILLIDPDGETIKVSTDKPELVQKFTAAISTAFAGKVEAKVAEDGTVSFHQLPDTKLTEREAAALTILNQAAGSKYVASLVLVDKNNGGDKVPLDKFSTGQFDIDDMTAFGNDDNLLTSKSVLVHTVVEQLKADELRKHGMKDENEIYDASHQAAIESEMQTTNIMRSTQAEVIIQDANGGSTSINNALLREDGKYKEVKLITKFQNGDLESQRTEPIKK